MYWGEGSTLGLLTFVGYLVFVFGAALVWRGREEVSIWIHDEAGEVRRSFSRYTVVGPFYGPREESRQKIRTIRRHLDERLVEQVFVQIAPADVDNERELRP